MWTLIFVSKLTALNIQFCTCQPDLIDYLAEEIIRRIGAEWRHADRLDIWTFDTWGAVCHCQQCSILGNASDRTLHFLSQLRDRINRAVQSGRLDQNVQMVMTAYEGTCTIEGPQCPIPPNLINAGDHINYAPILRCYAHDFGDPGCDWNRGHVKNLKSWMAPNPKLSLMVEGYFNVSRFEDLPLLFIRRMVKDLPAYRALGVRAMTYMHLPMVNWAMRTLTQALYAQLAWNVETDLEAFLSEYFENWYGPCAATMRRVYALIEEAGQFVAQWRAWGDRSILTQLAAYHDALRCGDDAVADQAWARVEQTADRMDRYWVPMVFDCPGPGFECKDALTRTQLRTTVSRCRYYRQPTQQDQNREKQEGNLYPDRCGHSAAQAQPNGQHDPALLKKLHS